MKKFLVAAGAAIAAMGVAVPAASAQPPDAVVATVQCDGFEPVQTWLPNFNAAFVQGAVGVTGIVIDPTDGRVGVTFASQGVSLRGVKPIDERGVETVECDVMLGPLYFEDVVVHVVP